MREKELGREAHPEDLLQHVSRYICTASVMSSEVILPAALIPADRSEAYPICWTPPLMPLDGSMLVVGSWLASFGYSSQYAFPLG